MYILENVMKFKGDAIMPYIYKMLIEIKRNTTS